ncbi:hypothetical protein [Arundinibacter roseus]|uniref:Uncharacterized protein n=1 Tax=Arundinibacter roseus TaxID=2070510 RepID=A0A4R4KCG6_9BACT|nr:hypothetical protein [Arundinibacter roseus]TDB64376.1 hypothetical protein EZE20_11880 [Arundinibacter roseus]
MQNNTIGQVSQHVELLDMAERTDPMLIGIEGKRARRQRIKELISTVKGNRGWRKGFTDRYPAFDSLSGSSLLTLAQQGRTDDPELLKAIEEWIPFVIETQPDWFIKQNHLRNPPIV